MRIVHVRSPRPKPRRRLNVKLLSAFLLLLVLVAGTTNYLRPLPAATITVHADTTYPAKTVNLTWPAFGQSALMTSDGRMLGSSGNQVPIATASIAKVITSLCILQKYPLKDGEQGPSFTIGPADVALYNNYVAKDGSAVQVQAGEQLTEYQLIQAMLLPSANNLADSAAIWAFGSLDNYITYANQYLKTNLLDNTLVAVDASGFDGATTSTATDLVHIGALALKEPAIVAIAAQPSAQLPVVGTVYNYNAELGDNGVNGLKTGNNDQDLGAFLFTATNPVTDSDGKTVTIIGATLGAGNLRQALQAAPPLIGSAVSGFNQIASAPQGTPLITYRTAWGALSSASTKTQLVTVHWQQDSAILHTTADRRVAVKKGAVTGSSRLSIGTQGTNKAVIKTVSVDMIADKDLAQPSFWWRLTRH